MRLDKIDLKFRELTDLFLFSNRMDIDLSNFKSLLKINHIDHFEYFISQFKKSINIFWENSEALWQYRLRNIFSFDVPTISSWVSSIIEKRIISLILNKKNPDPKYDVEFIQFLAYCKCNNNIELKMKIGELAAKVNAYQLINVVKKMIPTLFKNLNEFAAILVKQAEHSTQHYVLLSKLEEFGVKFNKKPLAKMVKLIINDKLNHSMHNYYTIMRLIRDNEIRSLIKEKQSLKFKKNFLFFIKSWNFLTLDNKSEKIIDVIDVCPDFANEIGMLYIDQVYQRGHNHKKARADLIINLLKSVPQISKKKMLSYLVSKNKMTDIKYIISNFPELDNLSVFI